MTAHSGSLAAPPRGGRGSAFAIFLSLLALPPSVAAQPMVEGRVSDAETSAPIEDARLRVVAWGTSASAPAGTILASVVTTPGGRFGLPVGVNGVLEVEKQGFAVARARWPPTRGAVVEIGLERGARLLVRVTDALGRLVPAVVLVNTLHPGNLVSRTVSSPDGIVQLDDGASGFTTLVARADGFAPAAMTLNLRAGEAHGPINIVVQLAGRLQGRVIDASGTVVAGAAIIARYDDAVGLGKVLSSYLGGRLTSDADGGFELAQVVPARTVWLHAEQAGRTSEPVIASVEAGGVMTDVVLVLR